MFTGLFPERYDRLLVPLLFEPYARLLAERVGDVASADLLEIAAGTGVVTRALVKALPQMVAITATDLNQPMLDQARTHPGMERVSWRQADALALPFPEKSFDAVVCQFGVMFFPNKTAAFREAWRVMRPGGWLLFSVWDRREESPLGYIASQVVSSLLAVHPASLVAPEYHDTETVRADLAGAGFGSITAEVLRLPSRAASARDGAIRFCHGSMIRTAIEARDPGLLAAAFAERFGEGPIDAPMQAILFTCRRSDL
ncbi:MAG: methyltransferase domain-containing protein [Stellaceae bacterium]